MNEPSRSKPAAKPAPKIDLRDVVRAVIAAAEEEEAEERRAATPPPIPANAR